MWDNEDMCCCRGGCERYVSISRHAYIPFAGHEKRGHCQYEETVLSIRNALMETESSLGVEINSVHVSISGAHIKGSHTIGAGGIGGREVTMLTLIGCLIPRKLSICHWIENCFTLYRLDTASMARME